MIMILKINYQRKWNDSSSKSSVVVMQEVAIFKVILHPIAQLNKRIIISIKLDCLIKIPLMPCMLNSLKTTIIVWIIWLCHKIILELLKQVLRFLMQLVVYHNKLNYLTIKVVWFNQTLMWENLFYLRANIGMLLSLSQKIRDQKLDNYSLLELRIDQFVRCNLVLIRVHLLRESQLSSHLEVGMSELILLSIF